MVNKTIAILDLNNFNDQNIEVLLFASILEKKSDKLTVIDLNDYHDNSLINKYKWTKKADISSLKLFNNTNYQSVYKVLNNAQTMQNTIETAVRSSDYLIVNTDFKQYKNNTDIFQNADEIVVFANFIRNIDKTILSFFLKHNIQNKKVHIIFYNFGDNVQHAKAYLSILTVFQKTGIRMSRVEKLPSIKTIDDIESIEPWVDIYHKIITEF